MDKNSDIKSLWPHKDPFAKPEQPKKASPESGNLKSAPGAPNANEVIDESALDEKSVAELKARGKLPTVIKVMDFVGTVEGNLLKIIVAVRNCGDALARDVKIKCIGNPRLGLVSSPMATVGDIPPRAKNVGQFAYMMPESYVEEYANFAVTAESENAKPYSQLFTMKTGRRLLTATEQQQQDKEKEKEKKGFKG